MNVNFNGLRRNATKSMNALHSTLNKIITEYDMYEKDREDLIKEFNEAAMFVDCMNCLYDDSVQGDMHNLSNLSISRLEDLEEDED